MAAPACMTDGSFLRAEMFGDPSHQIRSATYELYEASHESQTIETTFNTRDTSASIG